MKMFSLLRYKPKTLLSSFTLSRFAKFRADSKGGCFFDVFRNQFRKSVVHEVDLAVPNYLKAVERTHGFFFVDARWLKGQFKENHIQIGLTGRSFDGSVVFAKSCIIDLTQLMPRNLPKFLIGDMTVAEFCAFSYGVISGIESNLPYFDIITDSQIVKNCLTTHEENFYFRAEHEFLGTSCKALWFHKSPSGLGNVSWLSSEENVCADFLSRKPHSGLIEGGKYSRILWKILRNDVRGFYHAYISLKLRVHEKAGKNGADVIMGKEYDSFVQKALSMIQNQSGIDHSVPVNEARRSENAVTVFRNVVPRGSGIVHQVNHEYLGCVVFRLLYPGSVLDTDSLATMIDGLGVSGGGVGGIEAEATMLGQPMSMVLASFVGFKMIGKLRDGVTATDLVLTVTQMLRKHGVVGKFVEFYGQGMSQLSLADRATVANISAEYGAIMSYFPIDHVTLDYLKLTGRSDDTVSMIEHYLRANKMSVDYNEPQIARVYSSSYLELDLAEVEPSKSGA